MERLNKLTSIGLYQCPRDLKTGTLIIGAGTTGALLDITIGTIKTTHQTKFIFEVLGIMRCCAGHASTGLHLAIHRKAIDHRAQTLRCERHISTATFSSAVDMLNTAL